MILLAIIIGVFGTFLSFIYIRNISLRYILTIICLLILGISVTAIVKNDTKNSFMNKQTISRTQNIYPTQINNGINIMIYQNLGEQHKYNIQTYRKSNNQKVPSKTQVDQYTTNNIKYINSNQAHLKTDTERWSFTKSSKIWFGITNWSFESDNNDPRLIHRTNTFYIPKNWNYLSVDQAKQLGKEIQKNQSNSQDQQ